MTDVKAKDEKLGSARIVDIKPEPKYLKVSQNAACVDVLAKFAKLIYGKTIFEAIGSAQSAPKCKNISQIRLHMPCLHFSVQSRTHNLRNGKQMLDSMINHVHQKCPKTRVVVVS